MAARAWSRILLWALAGGFLAGAGQLGVAYGLGILRWDRQYMAGNDNVWNAQLTWAGWIAASAVIFGGWAGVWAARHHLRRNLAIGGRILSALAGAVGAAVVVPLAFLRARLPEPAVVAHPGRQAALAAALGLAVGVLVAVVVLSLGPVAGNVVATAAWVWLAAFVSLGRGSDAPRLAVLDVGSLMVTMLFITAVVAAAIAAVARWAGANRSAAGASGAGGPALVAAAYLIGGTGISEDHSDQLAPFMSALVAVAVGVAVSVAVAVVRKPARRPPQEPGRRAQEPGQGIPRRRSAQGWRPGAGWRRADGTPRRGAAAGRRVPRLAQGPERRAAERFSDRSRAQRAAKAERFRRFRRLTSHGPRKR